MFMDREAAIHFVGGAIGGTTGTAITCPLEVVKTRMQSSRGLDSSSSSTPPKSTATVAVTSQNGPSTSSSSTSSVKSTSSKNGFGSNFRLRGQFSIDRVLGAMSSGIIANRKFIPSTGTASTSLTSSNLYQFCARGLSSTSSSSSTTTAENLVKPRRGTIVIQYMGQIIRTQGIGALYKGLVPNLIGVAPSKAVYFYTYSTSKRFWNESSTFVPNSAIVHMVSAGSAGFVAASAVNPIWLVKTRLQLHHDSVGIWEMVKRVYQREGLRGFYKGVTASYAGVSETMIQFCIYEYFRGLLLTHEETADKRNMDFVNFMVAGGSAKFIACVMAYPHEVVRTRLREETETSRGFFKTLYQLYKEGYRSMYRGLSVQLMRTVPNTAITMGTYEFVVYMLHHL